MLSELGAFCCMWEQFEAGSRTRDGQGFADTSMYACSVKS
jgi:hypothetical protein